LSYGNTVKSQIIKLEVNYINFY